MLEWEHRPSVSAVVSLRLETRSTSDPSGPGRDREQIGRPAPSGTMINPCLCVQQSLFGLTARYPSLGTTTRFNPWNFDSDSVMLVKLGAGFDMSSQKVKRPGSQLDTMHPS